MSLINEALKKAQKERTGDSAPKPAIGGESAERIAKRGKSSGAPVLALGIGGAVLVAAIIGGVLFLQRKPSEPATPAPTVAVDPVIKPAEPAPRAVQPVATQSASTSAPATPPVTFAVPSAPTPAPATPPKTEVATVTPETPKPVILAPAPVTVATAAPVLTAAPPAPEPAKPTQPGKLEARAINYIETLRIAGIRASTTDSKVLMNDRVYRIGSVVEADMGLKLTGITAHSLTFEDERGASYTRTF